MPDMPRLPLLSQASQVAGQRNLWVTRLWPKRLRSGAAALLMCFLVCAALLPLGGCAVSVKPSGQVVTGVSVGR